MSFGGIFTGILAGLISAGCSSTSRSPNQGGESDAAIDSTTATDVSSRATLPFVPSNIPASVLTGDAPGAMVFDGVHCGGKPTAVVDTDKGVTNCDQVAAGAAFRFVMAQQPDGTNVAVFVTRSLRIDTTMTLTVTGQTPLVIVAFDSVQVLGTLSAAPRTQAAVAGGFSGRFNMTGAGNGPGAGQDTMRSGGGGGAYCGRGGKGATGNLGGSSYGAPTGKPLLGGSSGGNGGLFAGAGGGAIQLVAGTSIQIGATGVINVGGAGGSRESGGGSGGFILLESPVVTVAGVLAANGGGGGSAGNADGASGGPNDMPAPGGTDGTPNASGGDGGAGSAVDGTDGKPDSNGGSFASGGGGGAGYIRINSTSGAATVTGKLSPAATTTCVSEGSLG